jgi:hypothetical protein
MEFLNEIFKKLNLSGLEFFLFTSLGLILYKILQIPALLSFLNKYYPLADLNSFPNSIFFVLLWFLVFLNGKRIIHGFLKFLSSFFQYEFKSSDWPQKWERQGNIRLRIDENSLFITDSNSGCILKHHYWKNLEINFECKFPETDDDQTFGTIFRAESLSDYFMIQINKANQIVPHIRIEGKWETPRQSTYNISPPMERNVYYSVKISILNEKVELFINNIRYLEWYIPTNSDIPLVGSQDNLKNTFVPNIDFRKSYGRVGFRAFPGESVIIKNLLIRRIPNFI